MLSVLQQWQNAGKFPEGSTYCCHKPCIHGQYLYAGFHTGNCPKDSIRLWRAAINDTWKLKWEECEIALPGVAGGYWHQYAHFFTHRGTLYFAGKPLAKQFREVWKMVDRVWAFVDRFPDHTAEWETYALIVYKEHLVVCSGPKPAKYSVSICWYPLDDADPSWWVISGIEGMSETFHLPSVFIYKDRLHITDTQSQSKVYTLIDDGARNQWKWQGGVIRPPPLQYCAVGVVKGRLVACGGYNWSYSSSPNVYLYDDGDAANPRWDEKALPNLKHPRRRPYILSVDDHMICLSGASVTSGVCVGGLVTDVEVLHI